MQLLLHTSSQNSNVALKFLSYLKTCLTLLLFLCFFQYSVHSQMVLFHGVNYRASVMMRTLYIDNHIDNLCNDENFVHRTPWQIGKWRKTTRPWWWDPGGSQARQLPIVSGGLTGKGNSNFCQKQTVGSCTNRPLGELTLNHRVAPPLHLQGNYTAAKQLLCTLNSCCMVPPFDISLNFLF